MINQVYKVNVVPRYWPQTIIHVNQGDFGMTALQFEFWNKMERVDVTDATSASFTGIGEDNVAISHDCSIVTNDDGGLVSITVQADMTATAQKIVAEVSVTSSDGSVHTANFLIVVEEDPTE